jgi:NAD-dependent dihydropyrimidine dehydrogenase PreA subunit
MLTKLDEDRCTGCKICVDICPEDVLRLEGKKAHIAYPDDCIGCGVCAWFCPRKCIETSVDRARQEVMAF